MSTIEKIIKNLDEAFNRDGKYFITNDLDVSEKYEKLDFAKIAEKINAVLDDFLSVSNLHSEDTERLLENLKVKIATSFPTLNVFSLFSFLLGPPPPEKMPLDQKLITRIATIKDSLTFIRMNNVPRDQIQIGKKDVVSEPLQIPPNVSYALLLIHELPGDNLIQVVAEEAYKDKTPMILSYRSFLSVIAKLNFSSLKNTDWRVFKNREGTLVLLLPKSNEKEPVELLERYGYDPSVLLLQSEEDLKSGEDPFKEMPPEEYRAKIAEGIPLLFCNDQIKKRINLIGHGLSTTKLRGWQNEEGRVGGLLFGQFQTLVSQLEERGMDYLNLWSCQAGGRNALELFPVPHPRLTVSLCSVSDYPALGGFFRFSDSDLMIQFRSHKKFWDGITAAFKRENLQASDFQSALENMYGYSHSALPSVSIKGSRFFKPVNVHGKAQILSYQKMVSHELHLNRNGLIRSDFHSSSPIDPIHVHEECVLVYPQVIRAPLIMHKSHGEFPLVVSKIPDHNQIFFREIRTEEGTPQEIIDHSLMSAPKDLERARLTETSTSRLIVVGKLQGVDPKTGSPLAYQNVVVMRDPKFHLKGKYALYQKGEDPHWFLLMDGNETEVAREVVSLHLHRIASAISTTPEAIRFSAQDLLPAKQSNEIFLNAFNDLFAKSDKHLLEALDAIIKNNQIAFSSVIPKLTVFERGAILLCLLRERKKDWASELLSHSCDFTLTDPWKESETALVMVLKNSFFDQMFPSKNENWFEFIDLLCSKGARLNSQEWPKIDASIVRCPYSLEVLLKYQPDLLKDKKDLVFHLVFNRKVDLALKYAREYGAPVFDCISHSLSDDNNDLFTSLFEIGLKQLKEAAQNFSANPSEQELHYAEAFLRMIDSSFLRFLGRKKITLLTKQKIPEQVSAAIQLVSKQQIKETQLQQCLENACAMVQEWEAASKDL